MAMPNEEAATEEHEEDLDPGQDEREERGAEENDVEVQADRPDGVDVVIHKQSRRERKREEMRGRRQAEMEEFIKPLREENNRVGRQLAELTQLLQTRLQPQPMPQPQGQRQEPGDDLDPEIAKIRDQQRDIIARVKTASASEIPDLERRYHRLDQMAIDRRAEQIVEKSAAKFRPAPQPSYQEQVLRSEYPDVFANRDAEELAYTLVTQAKNRAKRRGEQPDMLKIAREALAQAAVEYGMRKAPTQPPSPAQAARFANRGSAGGPTRAPQGAVKRSLTPAERRMALLSDDSDISDAQKIANWTRRMEASGYFDSNE